MILLTDRVPERLPPERDLAGDIIAWCWRFSLIVIALCVMAATLHASIARADDVGWVHGHSTVTAVTFAGINAFFAANPAIEGVLIVLAFLACAAAIMFGTYWYVNRTNAIPADKRSALDAFLLAHMPDWQAVIAKWQADERDRLVAALKSGELDKEELAILDNTLTVAINAASTNPVASAALKALNFIWPKWRKSLEDFAIEHADELIAKVVGAAIAPVIPPKPKDA